MINKTIKKIILKNEFLKKMFLKNEFLKKKQERNKLMHKESSIFLKKNKNFKIAKYVCPCCGYPILKTKAQFEICPICLWEDVGQGESNKNIDYGRPNRSSLSNARYVYKTTKKNYDPKYKEYNDFLLKSNNLMKLFDEMIATNKINKNISYLIKDIQKSMFLENFSSDKKINSIRKKYFNLIMKGKIRNHYYVSCSCCGYPTIKYENYQKGFDICPICWWEDDGQDDNDAKKVYGGPNGNLSLEQARINFKKTLICEPEKFSQIINKKDKIDAIKLFDTFLKTGKIQDLKKAFKEMEKINKKYIFQKMNKF